MKYSLFIILSLMSCGLENGLEPIRSSIQGTITYSGEWPGEAAEVRLVAAKKFPPSGISDLIIGESLPLAGDSFDYKFYLDPAIYSLVGVAWREQNSIWDIISISGIYFVGKDSLSPGKITIETDTSTVKNIHISVNRAAAKRVTETRISGDITFQGTWPDSLLEVRVIATTKFKFDIFNPELPTLLDISFSSTIPIGTDSTSYTINAFPGQYKATGIIFFRAGQSLSIADILYSAQVGGLSLTEYEVLENQKIDGPDFQVKFN